MGQLKQLLLIGNKAVILHCLDSISASGMDDIVVVIRPDCEALHQILKGLQIKIVFNRNAGSEMAESVRTGLRAADPASTGIMVCLSDHPLVSPDTFKTLIDVHANVPGRILIPRYHGKKGHPVLLPAAVMKDVFSGDTLREVIANHRDAVTCIDVMDEGILLDLDTREDYETMLKRRQGPSF